MRSAGLTAAGQATARRAADSAWMHALGRTGLAARGVVYLVIAALAARVAVGASGTTADQKGALQQVSEEPFGRVLLIALAAGFGAYAVWRLLVAVAGEPGSRAGGTMAQAARRLGALAQGLIYAALAVSTLAAVAGSSPGASSGQKQQGWTARLMGLPQGRLLVALVGLVVVGAGCGLIWWAFKQKFDKVLMTERMGAGVRRWAMPVGTFGNSARGVIFGLVGLSLIKAARDFDPAQSKGLDDSLRSLAAASYGTLLLLVVAIGLLAYGVFSFVEARYRRM